MKLYLCMNEFAFMYVYVCMSLCVMLLDSVLINFIYNYLCMHEFAFMYVYAQGLVTIQVNILSMYKHIQGRTSFFTPLASSRVCFLNSF